MRKSSFIFLLIALPLLLAEGCRMAPSQNNGDTVAASEFYPPDTAALRAAQAKAGKTVAPIVDSADIFTIGPASTRHEIQLVSYPSHRDTAIFSKARHIKVKGNADIGRTVRIKFYVTDKGDSLVTRVESIGALE